MLTNVVAPDKLGGLERYVRELSAQLVGKGLRVTVIAKRANPRSPRRELASDGVSIVRYSPPSKNDPLFAVKYPLEVARGVASATQQIQTAAETTLLHGHYPVPMIPVLLKNAPFVYTCHAPVYRELLGERQGTYALPRAVQPIAVGGIRGLERNILRRARRVITLSNFIRSEVSALAPKVGQAVMVVPGGVDFQRFKRAQDARFPRDIGHEGPVIFSARRLVSRTGVEQLIDAFAIVARAHPTAHLVVAGDGSRREHVRQKIQSHGLEDHVHMIGYISDDELVAWYQSVDIAVTPTQQLEGFGLSTVEAMACGAVPLVTPIGANSEVVAGLPTELTSESPAPHDIADALAKLMDNPSILKNLRGDVIANHARKFSWDRVIEKHLEIYDGLAKSTSNRVN